MDRVGIDLGGTSVKLALFRDGKMVCKTGFPTQSQRGYEILFKDIAAQIRALPAAEGELESIGLAVPGLLSADAEEIVFASNLGFEHVPAAAELRKYFPCRVTMANDANAAALGEHIFGAGRGCSSSVTIVLGTGIGAGIILEDKIVNGCSSCAGELGHHIIVAGGRQCPCGQKGCYEMYASATALIADANALAEQTPGSALGRMGKLDAKKIYEAYYAGDAAAVRAVEAFIAYVGVGVINAVNFLQPEAVIIGGGVSAEKDGLIVPVREYVHKNMLFEGKYLKTDIRCAELGNDAGVMGSAML